MENKGLPGLDHLSHRATTSSPLHPKEFIASVLEQIAPMDMSSTNERFLDCNWDLWSNRLEFIHKPQKSDPQTSES